MRHSSLQGKVREEVIFADVIVCTCKIKQAHVRIRDRQTDLEFGPFFSIAAGSERMREEYDESHHQLTRAHLFRQLRTCLLRDGELDEDRVVAQFFESRDEKNRHLGDLDCSAVLTSTAQASA